MTDDQLDAIFKAGNVTSYAAALRAVYTQGIIDAVTQAPAEPVPAQAPEPIAESIA